MAGNLRQTAYKVWIANLISGKYVKQEGEWEPNYIEYSGLKISRVNIIASVVQKYINDTGEYSFIEIDDSSGSIRTKVWKEDVKILENIEIGDMVLVIGRVRESNSEIYILGEIVKKIDNIEWAEVRKRELGKIHGEATRIENATQKNREENTANENLDEATISSRQKVLSIMEKNNEIKFDDLLNKSELSREELDKVVKELLKEGEIYQPKAGVLKIV